MGAAVPWRHFSLAAARWLLGFIGIEHAFDAGEGGTRARADALLVAPRAPWPPLRLAGMPNIDGQQLEEVR